MLIDKLQEIYDKSKVKSTNERDDGYIAEVVERQYAQMKRLLMDNAKKHVNYIRMVTTTVHPKTIQRFREEGFIVWENSETTLIKFPIEK